MSTIFEDKQHNDPKYIGQKPVVVVMDYSDGEDAKRFQINRAVQHPMGTRNIPNKD